MNELSLLITLLSITLFSLCQWVKDHLLEPPKWQGGICIRSKSWIFSKNWNKDFKSSDFPVVCRNVIMYLFVVMKLNWLFYWYPKSMQWNKISYASKICGVCYEYYKKLILFWDWTVDISIYLRIHGFLYRHLVIKMINWSLLLYPTHNEVVGGYIGFTPSIRPSVRRYVRPPVRLSFRPSVPHPMSAL